MCFIEKRLHKIVPAMFDLFVTPLVSVFVTGYLTYSIIGPIFVTIENGIIGGVQQLITLPFRLALEALLWEVFILQPLWQVFIICIR